MYIFAYLYCYSRLIKCLLNYWFIEPPKLLPCPTSVCELTFENINEARGFDENICLTVAITIIILEIKPLSFVECSNDFPSGYPVPDCPSNMVLICQPLPTAALYLRTLREQLRRCCRSRHSQVHYFPAPLL